jgi:hypothetical protein
MIWEMYRLHKTHKQPQKSNERHHMSNQQRNDLPKGLAKPAQRALAEAGIRNLEQLSKFSVAEIRQLHGIGPNALIQLRRALAEHGLMFAGESED